MNDLSELVYNEKCRFCFYDTETEEMLCIGPETRYRAAWAIAWSSVKTFHKNTLLSINLPTGLDMDGVIAFVNDKDKCLFMFEIPPRLKERKGSVVMVPIESNSKLSFDLAIKL